jgi:hypothetical protein
VGILQMYPNQSGQGDKNAPQQMGPAGLDYSKLPKTGREYNPQLEMPYEEQVARFEKQAQWTAYSGAFMHCDTHKMGKVVFACDHCHEQDPVHPVGMVFSPFKYFLCGDCFKKHKMQSLDFARCLKTRCWNCILDEWSRISLRDPNLCVDLLTNPHAHKHGVRR